MGIDCFNSNYYSLRRCEECLVIKSTKGNDRDISEGGEKFQLTCLFKLLENGVCGSVTSSFHPITSLDLSHCELTELPNYLKFIHIRDLNVSHNKLTMVPLCLYGSGLDILEHLDLSYNLITHFDVEPDCMINLKKLYLNNNCFANIPNWFLTFRCIGLEELNYSENNAQHYNFSKHTCNFSIMKLRVLDLKNACLVDADLSWLKCFRNLQFLDISNKADLFDRKYINKFRDLDLSFSKPYWKQMKVLKLTYLNMAFFPEGIVQIESLTELHISNNLLSWFPDGIELLVNLAFLDISCNEIIMLPKQISKLANLKALIAYANHLDDIPKMPDSLEILDLYDNYIQTIEMANFLDVSFIDVDYNFICLSDQHFAYKEYCVKRDQFRVFYDIKDRICNCKVPENSYNDLKYSSDSSYTDYEFNDCDSPIDNDNFDKSLLESQGENWDETSENSDTNKHPQITASDDEYCGEDKLNFSRTNKKFALYLKDEDWLFVDAD